MEHLLNGKLFSWLKEGAREMENEEMEMVVLEFVEDLVEWSEKTRGYSEVSRGLESLYIRLQVWNEVYQVGDGIGKKHEGSLVPVRRVEVRGTGNPVGAGTAGKSGMVRRAPG